MVWFFIFIFWRELWITRNEGFHKWEQVDGSFEWFWSCSNIRRQRWGLDARWRCPMGVSSSNHEFWLKSPKKYIYIRQKNSFWNNSKKWLSIINKNKILFAHSNMKNNFPTLSLWGHYTLKYYVKVPNLYFVFQFNILQK